jgi:hypothetical protein
MPNAPPNILGRVPVAPVPEPTRSLRGPFAGAAAHEFERRDFGGHFPLYAPTPGAGEPPPEPAPPPAPTEAELRAQLGVSITAARNADAQRRVAEEAYQRAQQHREACALRLASCADLDAQIAHAVAGALRSGTDAEQVRETFAERIIGRAEAQANLTTAEAAVTTLFTERDAAAGAAGEAVKAVDRLTAHPADR